MLLTSHVDELARLLGGYCCDACAEGEECEGKRLEEVEYTPEERACIDAEITKLRAEGMEQAQAVAVAIDT